VFRSVIYLELVERLHPESVREISARFRVANIVKTTISTIKKMKKNKVFFGGPYLQLLKEV